MCNLTSSTLPIPYLILDLGFCWVVGKVVKSELGELPHRPEAGKNGAANGILEDLEERVTLQQICKEGIASHDWRGSLRSVRPYKELDLGLSRPTHYRCYLQELGQEPPAKA